ncbi:hypothetical protein N0V88_007937 [Collariella sp. IMI 366227]|nr:hypothetical protein N0V88_007937 [Collariella sp. IMI 366227]
MGQRQQLFVIARVGKHYRCLAVVHHQLLCGDRSLETCLRLIKIFSAKENRHALEVELRLAAEFYKNQEPPSKTPPLLSGPSWEHHQRSPVRFPFVATCLSVGASIHTDHPDQDADPLDVHMTHFEREDTGFDQSNNNDGILVLDITHLDKVRYCYAAWFRIGWRWYSDPDDPETEEDDGDSLKPALLNTPWSGWDYAQHYIDMNSTPQYVGAMRAVSDKLADHFLIDVSALADVWPWGNWELDQSVEMSKLEAPATVLTGGASLKNQALAKVLQSLLTSEEPDVSLLDAPLGIPSFRKDLQLHLYNLKDDLVRPDLPIAAELLRAAFAGETTLDLARFPGLAPETIIALAQGSGFEGARALSLCPDWNSTEPAALAQAICAFPHLHDLYVMELPGRESEGPIGALYQALAVHPRCPSGRILLAGAASRAIKNRMWLPTAEPFVPPPSHPLLQMMVLYQTYPYHTYGTENLPPLYYFHLADAFLTPTRFANGLVRILTSQLSIEDESVWSRAVAHHFTLASSNFSNPSALEINPLPAEIYTLAKRQFSRSDFKQCSTKMRDLLPGAWTVLIDVGWTRKADREYPPRTRPFVKLPQNFFQVAFVRPREGVTIVADPDAAQSFGPDDIEVVDLEGFLGATAPGTNLEGLHRQLERFETQGRSMIDDADAVAVARGRRLSRTPMEPARACELLRQAIARLPEIRRWYRRTNGWGLAEDEKWYPELDLGAC